MRDYRRFYGLMKNMEAVGDPGEFKAMLVRQFTNDRTDSLRAMTQPEYDNLCRHLQREASVDRLLARGRHNALTAMELANIDTQNWRRINAVCLDRRIAGKHFYDLTIEELEKLKRKMYAIANKGGLPDIDDTSEVGDKTIINLATKFFTA